MFLLSKIVSKSTPKLSKLHLTTIPLFKAKLNKIAPLNLFPDSLAKWLGYNSIIFVQ